MTKLVVPHFEASAGLNHREWSGETIAKFSPRNANLRLVSARAKKPWFDLAAWALIGALVVTIVSLFGSAS